MLGLRTGEDMRIIIIIYQLVGTLGNNTVKDWKRYRQVSHAVCTLEGLHIREVGEKIYLLDRSPFLRIVTSR